MDSLDVRFLYGSGVPSGKNTETVLILGHCPKTFISESHPESHLFSRKWFYDVMEVSVDSGRRDVRRRKVEMKPGVQVN